MFGKNQVLLLLLVSGLAVAIEDGPFSYSSELSEDWADILQGDFADKVHSAKVDKLFDAILPTLQQLIRQHNMDPMRLDDISMRVLPLPGKLKGKVDFTNGWLQELSRMKRTEHVIATYADKRLILELNLGFDLLDFNYSYFFKYLLVKRVGDVFGRFRNANCRVIITVDMEQYKIYLDSIKFRGVEKFDVKFEGRLLDPLVNAITKAVTTVFRQRVLRIVEEQGLQIFRKVFEDINDALPVPNRPSEGVIAY